MSPQWFAVIDSSGQAVSLGTVVANPLPTGLSAIALPNVDSEALLVGRARWDARLRAVVMLPPPIPESVEPWALARCLLRRGVRPQQIDAIIDAIQDPVARDEARIDWTMRRPIRRSSPLALQIGSATGEDMDTVFRAAAEDE